MLSGAELRTLLVQMLTHAAGGSEDHWRRLVREVAVLPLAMNPHCNWTVRPKGNAGQRAAIDEAVRLVREEHPFVGR